MLHRKQELAINTTIIKIIMNEEENKKIWKYIGLMDFGALGLYQLIKGENTAIWITLWVILIFCFIKYLKD